MKKLPLFAVAAIGVTLGVTAIAGAGGSIPTTVKFKNTTDAKSPNPNVLTFNGSVASPKAKCESRRKLVFAKRPQNSNGPYSNIGTTKTDGNAKWHKDIDVTGFPDIRVKAPAKTFGSPPKRCAPDTIFLSK